MTTQRIRLTKSSKSLLWQEKDRWLIRGLETKKVHAKFRLKSSALADKSHIENIHLEKCEIVFEGGLK